jgi:hypothetical protein
VAEKSVRMTEEKAVKTVVEFWESSLEKVEEDLGDRHQDRYMTV